MKYIGDNRINHDLTVAGDLTVSGTTTTVNSTTLTVDDKNIELAHSPSGSAGNNSAVDGGGITLISSDGNKTFNWVNSTASWTSSEHLDLASGKSLKVNGTSILTATTLSLEGAGTIDTSGNNALAINSGSANLNITAGTLALTGAQTISSTLGVSGLITASGGVSGALTGNVTGNISGNVTGGTISGTTGTFSGDVTLSKDAPYLIMTDSGTGGGTSKIAVDAVGSNHGFYFQADGSTNHVILESNGDFKVDADTLFVDASEDRVGVNTATPQYDFEVAAGASSVGAAVTASSGQVELQSDGQIYGYQKLSVPTAGMQIKGYSDGGGTKTQTAGISLLQKTNSAAGGYISFLTHDGSSVAERATVNKNGDFTVDTDTLFVDASADRVGVNNASPQTIVHAKDGSTAYVMSETTGTGTSAGFRLKGDASADYTIFTTQGVGSFGIYDNANTAQRLTLSTSGNMGLGVTPSAWGGSFKALQVNDSVFYNNNSGDTFVGSNYYWDGANNKYINTDYSAAYGQQAGAHIFYTAPSGTAGNTVSFTQAMTLTNAGNLGLGTSSPAAKLDINGAGRSTAGTGLGSSGTGAEFFIDGGKAYFQGFTRTGPTTGSFVETRFRGNPIILEGGNVGIGTASPTKALSVVGDAVFDGPTQTISSAGAGRVGAAINLDSNYSFENGYSVNGTISGSDYLGAVYFNTADTSGNGAGVGAAIRSMVLDPYGRYSLDFHTTGNSASEGDDALRMRIDHQGNLLVGGTSQSGTANRAAVFSADKFGLSIIDTTAQAADVGGALNLGGNYRSAGDAQAFARIEAVKENSTDANYAYGMAFSTTANGAASFGTEALRITSAGRVGINATATQNAMLMIEQDSTSTAGGIQIGRSDGGATYAISNVGSNLRFGVSSNGNGTVDINTATFDYQGLVGIGTTSPQVDFHVDNASTNGVARISTSHSTSYAQLQLVNQSGNYWYQTIVQSDNSYRLYNGSDRLILDSSGNLKVDTDTLYVDAVNDRVGVNQASPTASLTVQAAHNTLHTMKIENAAGNVVQETYINGDGNGVLNIRNSAGLHKMQFSTYENSFINAGYSFGVGTSSPRYDLAVKGNSATAVGIAVDNDSGSATLDIAALGAGYNAHGAAAGEVWFYSPDNINIGGATGGSNDIKFLGGGAERMRITSDGRFGFGTSSPVVQIGAHFVMSVGTESYMNAQSGYYVGLHPNSANESQHIDAHSNGAGTSSIYIGNEVIQTSSDIRAKKNIKDYSKSALSVLDKARVVEFEYRPEVINDESEYGPASRGKYVGLIAQEMIEYARWAVNDGDGDPDGEHIWTAKYELMVPLLIKAVQELTQRVTELENN